MGDLVCLRPTKDRAAREVELYNSLDERIYDPSGTFTSDQIALVVSHELQRFVKVLCPTGLGWVPVEELGLLIRRAGANSRLDGLG